MRSFFKYIFISIFLLINACENREWNNPFDPGCPKEIFTPTNITATQEGDQIILSWNQTNSNITGFKIERQVENESFTSIASPGKNETSATNNITAGGKLHTYKLYALAGSNKSNEVTTSITPVLQATITTKAVTEITATSAISGGTITDDGGGPVTARGVVWSTASNPTLENNEGKTEDGSGTGSFTSELTGLEDGTKYYVRAYATNSKGTNYGDVQTFSTLEITLPEVTTASATNITVNSAKSGGEVISDGNSPVTLRGIVWNTTGNPTLENYEGKTENGSGTGSYTSELTGLEENTNYFVKAYATNSMGTVYGNEVSFKTDQSVSLATVTTIFSNLTSTGAVVGGNVVDDGNTEVTERGVCWIWEPWGTQPTKQDSFKIAGSGTGGFSVELLYLESNTSYYVRAYAINSKGISYGETISFTTAHDIETGTFTDSRDNIEYKWVKIGEQIWMAENLAYLPAVSPPSEGSDTLQYYYVYGYNGTDVNAAKTTGNYITYGVLYNWPAALEACPEGWHLPSDDEWVKLGQYISDTKGPYDMSFSNWLEVGKHLKSKDGWNSGNGTDDFDFYGLPGGACYSNGGFDVLGFTGQWWTKSEFDSEIAWRRILWKTKNELSRGYENKASGLSLRCIKD